MVIVVTVRRFVIGSGSGGYSPFRRRVIELRNDACPIGIKYKLVGWLFDLSRSEAFSCRYLPQFDIIFPDRVSILSIRYQVLKRQKLTAVWREYGGLHITVGIES
jgi:hypothetical protein